MNCRDLNNVPLVRRFREPHLWKLVEAGTILVEEVCSIIGYGLVGLQRWLLGETNTVKSLCAL